MRPPQHVMAVTPFAVTQAPAPAPLPLPLPGSFEQQAAEKIRTKVLRKFVLNQMYRKKFMDEFMRFKRMQSDDTCGREEEEEQEVVAVQEEVVQGEEVVEEKKMMY